MCCDQHFVGVGGIGEAFAKAGDETGSPFGIEVSFRFIEQEQAVGVLEQQAQAETVQQLMFAVGQAFQHDGFVNTFFREFDELESHDALVGSARWDSLADVVAVRLIERGLQAITDRVEIERKQNLKCLEEGDWRFFYFEVEVVAERPARGIVDVVVKIKRIRLRISEMTGGTSFQPVNDSA